MSNGFLGKICPNPAITKLVINEDSLFVDIIMKDRFDNNNRGQWSNLDFSQYINLNCILVKDRALMNEIFSVFENAYILADTAVAGLQTANKIQDHKQDEGT